MITEKERDFMINNIFLNQESEQIDLDKIDMAYLWKTIEVAVKGSLHPEPGVAFLAQRLHSNVKDSMVTVGICFLEFEKLVS